MSNITESIISLLKAAGITKAQLGLNPNQTGSPVTPTTAQPDNATNTAGDDKYTLDDGTVVTAPGGLIAGQPLVVLTPEGNTIAAPKGQYTVRDSQLGELIVTTDESGNIVDVDTPQEAAIEDPNDTTMNKAPNVGGQTTPPKEAGNTPQATVEPQPGGASHTEMLTKHEQMLQDHNDQLADHAAKISDCVSKMEKMAKATGVNMDSEPSTSEMARLKELLPVLEAFLKKTPAAQPAAQPVAFSKVGKPSPLELLAKLKSTEKIKTPQ